MDLYILRHAIAEPRTKENERRDAERRLTPEGEKKMQIAAEGMKAEGLEFDMILSSPYLRARQTAELVAEVFKARKALKLTATLAPNGDPRKLVAELNAAVRKRCRRMLLVGHEPYLSSLISLLVSGNTGLEINLKKGGLCKLTVETLRYGRCAKLEWLLTSRQLRSMD